MNRRQKMVLCIGTLVLGLMLLFPPIEGRTFDDEAGEHSFPVIDYRFGWQKEALEADWKPGYVYDTHFLPNLLAIQIFVLAAITGMAYGLVGEKAEKSIGEQST